MAKVRLVNISKRRGARQELSNINLEIKDKEAFVLAGPPGSGKTRLLRIVAGLDEPDTGEVYIGDERVNDVPPHERDVAMVFQNLALYPAMTAFQNIAFPLRQQRVSPSEIHQRVHDVARMLAIDHLLDRLPQTFSGGEQQRVALARAMIRRPKVYLLDQPLANLDALIRANMRTELKRIVQDLGQTIIYATHDHVEALSMGARIAVMDRGTVFQVGTPDEVYDRPKNLFVANFLGSPPINVFDSSLEVADGRVVVDAGFCKIELLDHIETLRTARSSRVLLGVRPEDVRVGRAGRAGEAFSAEVLVTEPLGPKSIVNLKAPGGASVTAVIRSEEEMRQGDRAIVQFDARKIHVFDKQTQEAYL